MPAALPEEMRALYQERRDAIRARLADFAAVPPAQYLYELCYCLLTPQSSARNVDKAIRLLQAHDFYAAPFDPAPILRSNDHYVRFHLTKAKRLLKAREQFPEIASHLHAPIAPQETRAWLVKNVDGMSLKEASHFLRNIGVRDLAIIDRHILTHLVACGVIRSRPASLTAKRYHAIERRFKKFAAQEGIPMDELDLLFWSREAGEILK